MSVGLSKRAVRVEQYDETWPAVFEGEKESLLRILAALSPKPLIEHIGGTSVRDLPSKPIIDIAIGCQSGEQVSQVLKLLLAQGREYVKEANQPGMLFMAMGDPRRFHYHLVVATTPAWRKLIAFRNHLRRHPGLAADYGAMKLALAERFPESRFDYTRYKRPILRALLFRASAEARRRRHAAAIREQLAVSEAESRLPTTVVSEDQGANIG